nr:MAG TPA: hypothetical protein [Bacteriophage sp.]
MKFSYYNLEKGNFNKKYSNYKKKKLFTIYFNHILEEIQFENSDRGILLWIITPKTVRVFGCWKQGEIKKFYRSWTNNHCECC